jgi:hypothetical protein
MRHHPPLPRNNANTRAREEVQQGRLRRYYRLTESGVRALEAEAARLAGNVESARRRLRARHTGGIAWAFWKDRYRQVLRVLPASYRAERQEEMVCAFLEGSGDLRDEDNPRPRWPEIASVVALSVRVRVGGVGAASSAPPDRQSGCGALCGCSPTSCGSRPSSRSPAVVPALRDLGVLGSMMVPARTIDFRFWSWVWPWLDESGLACLALLAASVACIGMHLWVPARRAPSLRRLRESLLNPPLTRAAAIGLAGWPAQGAVADVVATQAATRPRWWSWRYEKGDGFLPYRDGLDRYGQINGGSHADTAGCSPKRAPTSSQIVVHYLR